MKENSKSQTEGLKLPPTWCASLCRNAMNEKCIEECALKRDCSGFDLKPGIDLIDVPRFPIDEIGIMTKEEKFTSVAVYLAVLTDHLKGVESDQHFIRRPRSNDSRASQVSQDQQGEVILFSSKEEVAPHQDREKHPGSNIGH